LDLGWPEQIACSGGEFVDTENISNIPDTQDAIFKYPSMDVVWTNRAWGNAVEKDYPWAMSFFGSQGTLKMSLKKYEFIPFGGGKREVGEFLAEEASDLEKREERYDLKALGATRRHLNILEGHISSSACVLANNAMELGRSLTIDTQTGHPKGDAEATKLLARDYRSPWIHPTVENV